MTIPQTIIQYLEDNGAQSKTKICDYTRDVLGTTGDCAGRRLRELVRAGKVERVAKDWNGKKYIAYRVAEVKIPIVGTLNSKTEEIIFEPPKLL